MARENDSPPTASGSQPGLDALRDAVVRGARRGLGVPPKPRRDAVAGLSVAIANVPDGLANAVLVGANPVFGLYATMLGPLVGGLFSSTQLMVVTTTAAASLTAGQALASVPAEARPAALVLLVVLVGVFQVAAGLFGLGRLTRYVSYSVTTGFLTGVAVLLVLSQLPTAAGIEVSGANRLTQTFDLLTHADEINPLSLGMAALALALAILLPRTPAGKAGGLIAVLVPSIVVYALGLDQVATVADLGEITPGVPVPVLPSLVEVIEGVTGALSVAVVILVQGAGVSQSVPNPDGTRSRTSRDFVAQGVANIASGFFRGIPVGGSVSTTALSVTAGARTRWAAILAGLWMAVILATATTLVGYVAMPALGALLIYAGLRSIKPTDIRSVWDAGPAGRLAGGTTFLAMLVLPIQAAVGIGAALSALLFLREASANVRVVEIVSRRDGKLEERDPPASLRSRRVTVLDVHGELYYAGARTLEEILPEPTGSDHPAVVLRLRGRTAAGATLVDVLYRYSEAIRRANGRLYLTGLRSEGYERLLAAAKLQLAGRVRVYEATPILGESTRRAVEDAREWLAGLDGGGADHGEGGHGKAGE